MSVVSERVLSGTYSCLFLIKSLRCKRPLRSSSFSAAARKLLIYFGVHCAARLSYICIQKSIHVVLCEIAAPCMVMWRQGRRRELGCHRARLFFSSVAHGAMQS